MSDDWSGDGAAFVCLVAAAAAAVVVVVWSEKVVVSAAQRTHFGASSQTFV